MNEEMTWQDTGPSWRYLAGSIAAREWRGTAEEEADSVGLEGEARAKFLQGWINDIAEQQTERREQIESEAIAME